MLKYIWQVSQDLFLTVTFVTLIYVMALRIAGKKALRIQWTGIVLGITASVIFAYVKNQDKDNTGNVAGILLYR